MKIIAITAIVTTLLVIVAVLPNAFSQFFNADTETWGAATTAIWGLIPLVIIVGIVLHYVQKSYGDDAA
jgi:ABC-type microcin C transport system permease subunit YejE